MKIKTTKEIIALTMDKRKSAVHLSLLLALAAVAASAFNCSVAKQPGDISPADTAPAANSSDGQANAPGDAVQAKSDRTFRDSAGNTINYDNAKLYLAAGIQSELSAKYLDEINSRLIIPGGSLDAIAAIFKWKQGAFKASAAGGKYVGKSTVKQLMETKALTGCHDHGLLLASVFRKYGFPAVMVDCAGMQWALNYVENKPGGFIGHVFVEANVDGRWILVNSTSGKYVDNYEPCNPVIPMPDQAESKGYYVLFKGLDPAGYGITSNEQLTASLKSFAGRAKSIEMPLPPYKIRDLPR